MNTSPRKVTIDLSTLRYNLLRIRELVGEGTRIMGTASDWSYISNCQIHTYPAVNPCLLTMDQNLTVKKGDRVCFLGKEKRNRIKADDMARWANKISYEVLCFIGSRNKRENIYEKEVGQDS